MTTVLFLGSGDAFGSGGRAQTCIAVQTSETHVLLDCGATALVAMKRHGVDPGSVDAVLLTHLHGDHFGGLPFLVLDAQFARRARPLTVAGPPGTRARTLAAMEVLFPGSAAASRRFDLRFVELPPRAETALGAVRVTGYEVRHASGAPAYALRLVCGGTVVAYSGDTAWTEALLEAARGADLFICEAYFFDKVVRDHLAYATLRQHRAELGCRRLILTHLSAELLGRRAEVADEVAEDGLRLRL
jgi:ribonuclease BN (tRNA processing enzyme)